ncbi:MAG: FAD-dependent oxidoreductase [Candidatus Brocadia sp.]|nr:FAD-dependent oxidoreductase [Candidatus Brocadia sp.]
MIKGNDGKNIILGGGITGLSAGISTGIVIYEANNIPGGICASYYVNPSGKKSYSRKDDETYRFEIGGGHWIFGADKESFNVINSLSQTKSYERKSSVYLSDLDIYVPYPIQNHLFYLPQDIRNKALEEILHGTNKSVSTLSDWLEVNFGKTLCDIFFFPFHELYTAGLYTKTAPQDKFKTPVNKDLIIKGAKEKTPSVGYNVTFIYPEKGLDDLISKMADRCRIHLNKKVVKISIDKKEILFEDDGKIKYDNIFSTLPLNKTIEMTGLNVGESDPFTSVLVVNIGALKGAKCPDDHWIYVPKSKTGFHRVGFYSHVDSLFLPITSRKNIDRVSIYVEKAFRGGEKPSEQNMKEICNAIVKELQEWKFITEAEVVNPTWVEIAYTWQYPDSNWREKALEILKRNRIYQTGRYGRWKFQGIAESIMEGFDVNGGFKNALAEKNF